MRVPGNKRTLKSEHRKGLEGRNQSAQRQPCGEMSVGNGAWSVPTRLKGEEPNKA